MMVLCRVTGILLVFSFFLVGSLTAQVSQGGTPVSFNKLAATGIDTYATERVDVDALLAEDKIEEAQGLPFRFGKPFDVDFNLDNSGTWDELPDGARIWRFKIVSPGAFSINLIYSSYWLPEGATLFVYNDDHSMIIGAFTSYNNKDHGQFATAPVAGDVTIVEYYEPAEVRGMGMIAISRVIHGYKDIFGFGDKDAKGFGSSGSCNNNVNCPEGLPWQDEKRGVAMILLSGGARWCSGCLVNNVRQDQKPYFLTADHCLGGEATWIFMFNYESPGCEDIDGPLNYTVSGSTLRASNSTSDFGLVELSIPPPDHYNVYFAGWSNLDVPSQSSTCIHHPSGDIKKISFDYDPVTSTNYLVTSGTTHWRVGNWEDGTTEPGSSGSPLFDQNHRIVGQLHGGYASCTSITADWFGKFSMSWDWGGSASSRLRDWLDPENTGATTLDGFDPYADVMIVHTPLEDTRDTLNDYEVICEITAPETLDQNELKLHYDVSAFWDESLLQPTGGGENEYHGFIPAQTAGTDVSYYISAGDQGGNSDTTDIFSFYIDYTPDISVTPGSFTKELTQGDSTTEGMIIENVGNGEIIYSIAVEPALKFGKVLEDLQKVDQLAPAARDYSESFLDHDDAKGIDDARRGQGFPVDKDAGGPDGFGYYWIDSEHPSGPTFDWIDISGTGTDITAGLADDNYTGPYSIGLDFPFYGQSYNEIYVGSNGIIGFDTTNMKSRAKTNLPNVSTPNNILAWLWDDLDLTDADNPGARVYLQTDGNRCIVQFVDYPEYRADPGDVITAQVILDLDGTITYQYLSIAPGFDIGSCAVGIENRDGTDGLEVVYLTYYLHDSLAVQFFMPYQWLTLDKYSGTVPPGESDNLLCTFTTGDLDSGTYVSNIIITSNDPDQEDNPWLIEAQLTVTEGMSYICGDANGDEDVNVADGVYVINYVFKDGPPPDPMEAGDANCDGGVNVADAVYIVNYVFKDGPEPCCP